MANVLTSQEALKRSGGWIWLMVCDMFAGKWNPLLALLLHG